MLLKMASGHDTALLKCQTHTTIIYDIVLYYRIRNYTKHHQGKKGR